MSWMNVYKRFDNMEVLRGVTLVVRFGEILGLLGPNGAGKTTLVSIACGLETPDRGQVVIATDTIPALMPQEHALYPTLTARENLRFFAAATGVTHGDAAREVDTALEQVGLTPHADKRVSAFSGGMKRRLSLSASLLGAPKVVILDEPTTGVDPQSRVAIIGVARDLAQQGAAVVYCTHYMEEVQANADRVAILHEGRLLADAPVGELLETYGKSYVEVTCLAESQAVLLHRLRKLGGISSLEVASPENAVPLTIRLETTKQVDLEGITRSLRELGTEVIDIRLREPTLEAVFIGLTGRELRD